MALQSRRRGRARRALTGAALSGALVPSVLGGTPALAAGSTTTGWRHIPIITIMAMCRALGTTTDRLPPVIGSGRHTTARCASSWTRCRASGRW